MLLRNIDVMASRHAERRKHSFSVGDDLPRMIWIGLFLLSSLFLVFVGGRVTSYSCGAKAAKAGIDMPGPRHAVSGKI